MNLVRGYRPYFLDFSHQWQQEVSFVLACLALFVYMMCTLLQSFRGLLIHFLVFLSKRNKKKKKKWWYQGHWDGILNLQLFRWWWTCLIDWTCLPVETAATSAAIPFLDGLETPPRLDTHLKKNVVPIEIDNHLYVWDHHLTTIVTGKTTIAEFSNC